MTPSHTILVIEDEAPLRQVLRTALEEVVDRIVEAETAARGLELAAAERPALVVLDLGLPDRPGAEVCRELRLWARMPIVVLSARHSEQEKVTLLDLGADDYVTKPFTTGEFVARVRAHLRRGSVASSPIIEAAGLVIDVTTRTVMRQGAPVKLTPIEWEILRTLATQAGRTLTHRQIFDAVWDRPYGSPQEYLRVHVTNLRRKIELDPARPRLVVTEAGVGYRFDPSR
ncbi:MAG: two-component system response regulator KdpE [Gemmatimonadaceae bacterium]